MSQSAENKTSSRPETLDYKAKLDKAAERVKDPPPDDQGTTIVDKISEYVPPAVGKMLSTQEDEPERNPTPADNPISGLPERPVHDTQIEEFIKEQYRSQEVGDFGPKGT